MKKALSLLFLISCLLVSFHAKADDCSKGTDILCNALANVTAQVNRCQTLDDMDKIDYDSALNVKELSALPDECVKAPISAADKVRLKNGFNGFFDALSSKTYEMCKGVLTRADIDSEFASTKAAFANAVDKAGSYDELSDLILKIQ